MSHHTAVGRSVPIIWRIGALRVKLASGELPPQDAAFYIGMLFVGSALARLIPEPPPQPPSPYDWSFLGGWLEVAVMLAGVAGSYLSNGGFAGRDFAARFSSVLAVVGFRYLVLLLIPSAAIAAVASWWLRAPLFDEVVELLVPLVLEVLLFVRVAKHLRMVTAIAPAV